jgi:predicted Zn-dependent protease
VIRAPAGYILTHGALRRSAHTRHQVRQYQHIGEGTRRLKLTAMVTGVFILVAALAALITPLLVRVAVARIPVKWERQLGDKVLAEIQQEETMVSDLKAKLVLAAAVEPLLKQLPQRDVEYRFYILQDPFPNAFALPGGHVLVTTELLDLADTPEELAAVVAHELAHVDKRHGFRKIVSAAGPYVIFQVFLRDSQGVMGVVSQGSDLLVRQSFSQEYELEADDTAWDYLLKANIDPRGLASMLGKLTAVQRSYGATIEIPKAFQSHPDTFKRISRLNQKWKQLPKKDGFASLPPLPRR